MRLSSIFSIAIMLGAVLGALGVMTYDMVQGIRGFYDD